jgi:hypothetical protein
MVIDTIQREIFLGVGVKPGDFALFAEQAENLFMPSALFALDEYGVPVQTAQRLAPMLLPATSLNTVLQRLVRLKLSDMPLSPFEVELLEDIRRLAVPSAADGTVH